MRTLMASGVSAFFFMRMLTKLSCFMSITAGVNGLALNLEPRV